MSEPFNHKKFIEDLLDFKNKYPSVYIETWTPHDFAKVIADQKGEDYEEFYDSDFDKVFEKYKDIADNPWIASALQDRFDAENGTNWRSLEGVIELLLIEDD